MKTYNEILSKIHKAKINDGYDEIYYLGICHATQDIVMNDLTITHEQRDYIYYEAQKLINIIIRR